ncbi:S9 family peptidase [Marinicauda algicola]|uniref:S9 family peptidase n=1 Tax=Marinicauda algicola TaxID=2029849 RepID=A0A4S2H1A4_9PROT|nr:prolyl oligopeptidase family serine peptidase [Marinicauda algicola]TGY89305.1 S9 family peptidase [Marinicauda algicola]
MRHARRFLTASAALLALAACEQPETDTETETAETEQAGMTQDPPAEGVALNTAIQNGETPLTFLEEVEGEAALTFAREANEKSLGRLQADPRYDTLFNEALEILQSDARIPYVSVRGGALYNFWQDSEHTHGLWRRTTLESYLTDSPQWEVVLDLDALAEEEGRNWVWRGADCLPPAYDRCILTLSDGGSDAAVRREFDVATQSFVDGGFVVEETKGSTTWIDEDTLMIATALDPAETTSSGYPFVVKRWSRGTPIEAAETILSGDASDVGVWPARLQHGDGPAWFMAVEAETFFESTYWLLSGETRGEPIRLPVPAKSSPQALFGEQLVMSLEESWTPVEGGETYPAGAVVSFSLPEFAATGELPAVHVLHAPGPRQSIGGIGTTADRLFMVINENVTGSLAAFTFGEDGWTSEAVETPQNLAINMAATDDHSDIAFVQAEGFTTPDTLYLVDSESLSLEPVKSLPHWFDAEGITVEQREAESADGTMIPYFIVRPEGQDEPGPTLLYAYGGFQVSLTPNYSGVAGKLWYERGGTYVLANIRGGGEFGPAWHQAGLRTNRQRIYDDLIAVAEALIEDGITTSDQLGVMGGSNGGLLTGVMYTQRPDLWGAVISQVPLLDMLRFHLLLAGASWQDEYGFPDQSPAERDFLRSISPLHNVDPETDYPPLFLLTSTKDDRVHPAHARKMAYLLEVLGKDVLYYENIEGGHSAAANLEETARRNALEYTFLMQELMDG